MSWWQFKRRAPGRSPLHTFLVWNCFAGSVLIILKLFYRLRCSGVEHIPASGPVVFAPNHQSNLDPLLVGAAVLDRPAQSMARATLFKSPIFGRFLRLIDAAPVERGRGDAAAMKASIAVLRAGRTVIIFPEGTRSPDGRTGPMQRGVEVVARRGNAMIVPVAVEGTFEAFPRSASRPRLFGHTAIRFAPPMSVEELADDDGVFDGERLRRIIETMRLELRAAIRRRTKGRHPLPGPADRPYWDDDEDAGGDDSDVSDGPTP